MASREVVNNGKIRNGDVGTALRVLVQERDAAGGLVTSDVSTATTKNALLKAPSGEVVIKAFSFVTDGQDGLLEYLTEADVYAVGTPVGTWELGADIIQPGWSGEVTTALFPVSEKLT